MGGSRALGRTRLLAGAAVGLLAVALAAPAGAEHLESPRRNMDLRGFAHLEATEGFNTDVWPQQVDDRVYAYVGTWGTVRLDGSEDCPSTVDVPAAPQRSGVRVIDLTKPGEPEVVRTLGHPNGSQSNDVKVEQVPTEDGEIHLMAHSLEPCGALALVQALAGGPAVNDVPLAQTGFQLYDVSDPTDPQRLGTWNNGGIGTHNLYVFEHEGRAYVAAVHNEYAPDAPGGIRGTLQLVDVTDPGDPHLAAEWGLADVPDATPAELCEPRGSSAHCLLHDVWVEEGAVGPYEGRLVAYLSHWDAGYILLDVADLLDATDPTDPGERAFIGQFQDNPTEEGAYLDAEGNAHVAVPYEIDGSHYVIAGDEDFDGPGEVPHVRVDAAPEDAALEAGESFEGVEFTDTAPIAENPVVDAPTLESDDGSGCSYLQAQAAVEAAGIDEWIAVARRGAVCAPFQQKVTTADAAGAAGLIVVNEEEGAEQGTAAGDIPAIMIGRGEGEDLIDAIELTDPGAVRTSLITQPEDEPNPWGFLRVLDVTAEDPEQWVEVDTFKAPHVEGEQPDSGTFSAHNPVVGPDGRIYVSWYTDGVRVLEIDAEGQLDEVAWWVPTGEALFGDGDAGGSSSVGTATTGGSSPGAASTAGHPEDGVHPAGHDGRDDRGFWGSLPFVHPRTGELAVASSDIGRGLVLTTLALDEDLDEPACPHPGDREDGVPPTEPGWCPGERPTPGRGSAGDG